MRGHGGWFTEAITGSHIKEKDALTPVNASYS